MRPNSKTYIKKLKKYRTRLKKEATNNPLLAKEKAKIALLETGIIDKRGKLQEIVKEPHCTNDTVKRLLKK